MARGVILVALLGLTAWNATRSEALGPALEAYNGARYTTSLRLALDHLAKRPWSREASRVAALSLSRLDFATDAERYYSRAGGARSLRDQQIRAFGLVRGNHREDAIAAYTEILKRWPDDPVSLRSLATVQMTQGNMAEAIRLSERLAASPDIEDSVFGYTMAGSFNHNIRETERAASSFDRVLELDPELKHMPLPKAQFWTHYAQDLLDLGQADRAGTLLARALKEVGDDPLLYNLQGSAQHQQGELEEAERSWRRALELEPDLSPAWSSLGRVLLARDRPEEAVEALNRAAALEPNDPSIVYSLILANRRLGRTEEVERLTRHAEDLRRRFGTPTTGMGVGTPGSSP